MIFSAPSKTFIVGEYLALSGGRCLIANTRPRFTLTTKQGVCNYTYNASPAARFIHDNRAHFQECELTFDDPYRGGGGLGASTAEFLLLYAYLQKKQGIEKLEYARLLECYAQYAPQASGADLVAQMQGGLCHYFKSANCLESLEWPWATLDFFLVLTGNKVATHVHLQTQPVVDHESLQTIADACYASILKKEADAFAFSVTAYQNALSQYGLLLPQTASWIEALKSQPGVKAVKGCGALGADVLFVLHENAVQTALKHWFDTHHLTVVATKDFVTTGVEYHV